MFTVLFGVTDTEAAAMCSALKDVDAGVQYGNTSAFLTGETFGGDMIEGIDSIRSTRRKYRANCEERDRTRTNDHESLY